MRLHRWFIVLVSRVVPKDLRREWRAEWEAELAHREAALAPWRRPRRRAWALLRDSAGAFWDALWLQSSRWSTWRLFRRHWRLTLSALVSLAVALSATTVGLAAFNALLVRPPGVSHPRGLRMIHARTRDEPFGEFSYPEFDTYRTTTRAFTDIAAYPFSISSLAVRTARPGTEQVVATDVSDNFFDVLGVAPRAGTLTFHSTAAATANDVVISAGLWTRLGGGPDLVGRSITLNDQPVTIVGVVPDTFRGMTWGFEPELWMSFRTAVRVLGRAADADTNRTTRDLHLVGRLAPGVSDGQAATDLALIAAAIARDHPDAGESRSTAITPLTVTPPADRPWTRMILGALLFVVLITLVVACANVTNLLLGLAAARRHEMLVRAALGASRLQLVVPLLREGVMLGLAAGALASGLTWMGLARLAAWRPAIGAFLPTLSFDLRPDALVLVATMGVAVLAGLAAGIGPALRATADGLAGSLALERSTSEPRTARLRRALVVVQMAVATVVLVAVGLAVNSLVRLQHVPLGFSAAHLVYTGVDLARSHHDARTAPAFYARVRERLAAEPGVEAITFASEAPLLGYATNQTVADGAPPPADGHGLDTPYAAVDDRYFATLGVVVLQGRTFDARDVEGRIETVVINATLARRDWPGQEAIGRRLRVEPGHRLVEVIGVVADGKYGDIEEAPLPFMYYSLAQHYQPVVTIIARSRAPRETVMLALADSEPGLVLGGVGVMTLDDMLGISLLLPRVVVWTSIAFGVVALVLATFGLYGTVFYAVTQRRLEMGIRTALGARPRHLFAIALRDSGGVAAAGAGLGLLMGLALPPLAASLLFGIGTAEPLVTAAAALTSGAIVLATTYLVVRPWMRMATIDLLRR